ncbi:hypothetical protein [Flavobacterium reichenbachii]|uniref:Uncharacterized protein n=1 Tax=Flavobacterium reichenbachii TaxID=362418 RepID=A0A085ZNV5_9FLAO|nr:hypothetical protein [Flavobacterium reichenbachii]KFF06119.1 hypothetical protein IW19_11525 [Flavobacterium reichenbachii]OXB14658.1 hypothetical protein B0A68_11425 [Flavobacterium reichenbachii]
MNLFKQKKIIYSLLDKKDFTEVLNRNVESFKKDNSKILFEGKVDVNGNFVIYPSFDSNARNQIRPVIEGTVSEKDAKELVIELTFDLPGMMKNLIAFVVILNLILSCFLYFNTLFLKWYLVLFFMVIFCAGIYITYLDKVKKSFAILERLSK